MDDRYLHLDKWLKKYFLTRPFKLTSLSGDASFRRYFRVSAEDGEDPHHFIAMDAPPEKESIIAFAAIARSWRKDNIQTPEIFAEDEAQGFLLISDFGHTHYLDALQAQGNTTSKAEELYHLAFASLLKIQKTPIPKGHPLPRYDRPKLLQEMRLFTHWLLPKTLNIFLTDQENTEIEICFKHLVDSAMTQPQHTVHRDYHSRNLMVLGESMEPGILDFQDAVVGPITYDLVSLLRDCYIAWPNDKMEKWVKDYYEMSKELRLHDANWRIFQRWFDLMGLQRHLKASGIFSRLSVRDNKQGYLADIPLTLQYIAEVSSRYKEMAALHRLLTEKVLSATEVYLAKEASIPVPDVQTECEE